MPTPTPINKNTHVETCSMSHEGQTLTIETTYEVKTATPYRDPIVDDAIGYPPVHFPMPTRFELRHKSVNGDVQEFVLDGSGLAQLQNLLSRFTAADPYGAIVGVGPVGPKGGRRVRP